MLLFLIIFLAAFALSLIGTMLMRRLAPRLGLVDMPSSRKVHVEPTPLGGGIAMFVALWLTIGAVVAISHAADVDALSEPWSGLAAFIVENTRSIIWIFGGAIVLGVVGLIDDLRGLSPWLRLGAQVAVAVSLAVFDKQLITLFISNFYVCAAITVLWIVGITNTFNLLDNMDGLSGGVAFIVSALLMVVALQTQQDDRLLLAVFMAVMMGATGGFLIFNFPPAKIFMGDAGSTLLGYMLAVTTINTTYYEPGKPLYPVVVPLLIMAVPIFDTLSVVIIRISEGRSPFEADKNHFSHRLVALGMTTRRAVVTIYLIAAAVGLGATVVYHATTYGMLIVLIQAAVIFAVIALLEKSGRDSPPE